MPAASDVMPRVEVVVLNYNGLADSITCLESLRRVDYPALGVILVDNGSVEDPTAAALAAYPGVVVEKTGENLGYAGGNNRGIEMALRRGAEYILVLNNDTTVDPAIVTALLEAFATDPRLGIVGPVINFMDEPEVVMTDGVRFNPGPGTEFFQRLEIPLRHGATPVTVDIVNGCCMMVKASVIREVGSLDESLFIVHEESDFCLRVQERGLRCAVLGRTLVWHKGSSSFDRSGRQFQRYFDTRNLYYLLRRHTGRIKGSRSLVETLWHYFRYVSYRYEIERESGKPAAAAAVVEGLRDAIAGRTGPYAPGQRSGTGALQAGLTALHAMARARRAILRRGSAAA